LDIFSKSYTRKQKWVFFSEHSVLIRKARTLSPLQCKGNYSATSNNVKLIYWPSTVGEWACYV